jgi:hypothetical protein
MVGDADRQPRMLLREKGEESGRCPTGGFTAFSTCSGVWKTEGLVWHVAAQISCDRELRAARDIAPHLGEVRIGPRCCLRRAHDRVGKSACGDP